MTKRVRVSEVLYFWVCTVTLLDPWPGGETLIKLFILFFQSGVKSFLKTQLGIDWEKLWRCHVWAFVCEHKQLRAFNNSWWQCNYKQCHLTYTGAPWRLNPIRWNDVRILQDRQKDGLRTIFTWKDFISMSTSKQQRFLAHAILFL